MKREDFIFYNLSKDSLQYEAIIGLFNPSECKTVKIPLRIGLDKVKIHIVVESIDWKLLEARKNDKGNRFVSTRDDCNCLDICKGQKVVHWYSFISILLGEYDKLIFKKTNINSSDSCLLEIHVDNIKDHELLGNISNHSVSEEIEKIKKLYGILKEQYGITVKQVAVMKEVEINLNFILRKEDGDFDTDEFLKVIQMLEPYQRCLLDFKHSKFSCDGVSYIPLGFPGSIRQELILNNYTSGLQSKTTTRKVKIYNKSLETKIRIFQQISRIEYSLNSKKVIKSYLGDEDLFMISQDNLEKAFHRLTESLIREPIINNYKELDRIIETYFDGIDISANRKWRDNLISLIVDELSKFDCTYVITESHLLNWVKQMHGKSVKKNASVITKSLIYRLNKLNNTKVVIMENRQYEQLTGWLTKISGEDSFEIMYLKQESSP